VNIAKCLCGRDVNVSKLKACPACGMSSAQIQQVTPDQRRQAEEQRQRKRAEEARLLQLGDDERRAEEERKRRSYIDSAVARMRLALSNGRTPSLYRLILMPTEYSFMGQAGGVQPNVMLLADSGLDGWEIAGVIPRTTGLALTNTSGRQSLYGGGAGGLTDGAYLIMRLPVTEALLDSRPDYVETILSAMHDLSGATQGMASAPRIQPGQVGSPGGTATAGAAGGVIFAYGVTHTVYEDDQSDGEGGGDFDFG